MDAIKLEFINSNLQAITISELYLNDFFLLISFKNVAIGC